MVNLLNNVKPSCRAKDGVLSIDITDISDVIESDDWVQFRMIFRMNVQNPIDYIVDKCTIGFKIVETMTNSIIAKASSI